MQEIPTTIIKQLGGFGRLKAMIGIKEVYESETGEGVSFRFMTGRQGINVVNIELNGNDLYDIVFKKMRGYNIQDVSFAYSIGAADLVNRFEVETGLCLRLNESK